LTADPSKGNADTIHRPSPEKCHLQPHVTCPAIGCLFDLSKSNERQLMKIRIDQGNFIALFVPQMHFLTNHVAMGRGRPSSAEMDASRLFPGLPLQENADDRDVIRQWSAVPLDQHAWRAFMRHCVMYSGGLFCCGRNIVKRTHHAYTEATERGALNYLLYLHRTSHTQGALLPMPSQRPDWEAVQTHDIRMPGAKVFDVTTEIGAALASGVHAFCGRKSLDDDVLSSKHHCDGDTLATMAAYEHQLVDASLR